MTAIDDFAKLGEQDPFFKELDAVCKKTGDCGVQRQRRCCWSTSVKQ